jgi:membrane protein YqaA with SNARE-associated domain
MGMMFALAALWGFAEATLFFIVPDVLLTFIAINHGWRTALKASILAAAGAVMGGAIMYVWGASNAISARAALDAIPAISQALIADVGSAISRDGLVSMFIGAFSGVPYKIYAVEAGTASVNPASFLLLTVPARLLRFAAAIALASSLAAGVSRVAEKAPAMRILAAVWVLFYVCYFALMPN